MAQLPAHIAVGEAAALMIGRGTTFILKVVWFTQPAAFAPITVYTVALLVGLITAEDPLVLPGNQV